MKKIIHYCWFGGSPLPKLAKKCIKSWKKFYPEYEIIQWDETNFDININEFCKEAYKQKKWAFVSDVVRCYALKEYGGLYFDTDMLLKKPINDLQKYDLVLGWESKEHVAVGIIWAKHPNHKIFDELLNFYSNNSFSGEHMCEYTLPILITNLLKEKYNLKLNNKKNQILTNNIMICTQDYFYPLGSDGATKNITKNTRTFHFYAGSWLPRSHQLRMKFKIIFGPKLGNLILDSLVLIKCKIKIALKFINNNLTK